MTELTQHFNTLEIVDQKPLLTIRLNRPQLANAMSLEMVTELVTVMDAVKNSGHRVVLLEGAGDHFCAGGDIKDMQSAGGDSQKLRDFNRAFGHMIETADQLPAVVICSLKGAVMGGGFGLACVSDYAVADESTRFALPETSLGIIPAQIAPFVVKRMGMTQARRLALLGQKIGAEEALHLNLIHQLAHSDEQQRELIQQGIQSALKCAPQATAQTKALLHAVNNSVDTENGKTVSKLLDQAADNFAAAVVSEGREGASAFMEKRKPNWASDNDK
ncbi:enoyl-CoA hydratase [Thalassolituus sp. HI0120]|nr:enoyl-CoA hydratase [Thalassolituus sp. HI0120]